MSRDEAVPSVVSAASVRASIPRLSAKRMRRLLMLVVASMTVSGCLWAPNLSEIEREIARQLPGAMFTKDMRISLGPLTLGFARVLTGLIPSSQIPEASEAQTYLQDVRRLQVAVYRTETLPPLHEVQMPQSLKRLVQREGWHLAVKTQEEDKLVWVLTREDGGMVRDIYVVMLDPSDLILVRVEGRMEELLANAMENHADEIPQMLGLKLD